MIENIVHFEMKNEEHCLKYKVKPHEILVLLPSRKSLIEHNSPGSAWIRRQSTPDKRSQELSTVPESDSFFSNPSSFNSNYWDERMAELEMQSQLNTKKFWDFDSRKSSTPRPSSLMDRIQFGKWEDDNLQQPSLWTDDFSHQILPLESFD